MFDFESDKVDPRFARPGEGDVSSDTSKDVQPAETSPVTEKNNRPVSIPSAPIPPPPPIQRASPVRATPMRESPARDRAQKRRSGSTIKRSDWAWVVIAGALLFVVIVFGVVLVALVNAGRVSSDSLLETPVVVLPTPIDARSQFQPNALYPQEHLTLDDGTSIVLQPWDGTSRLNILLMGIDRRPDQSGLGYRSDTMMLVSLNPQTQQVGILSIPRDLYIQLPAYSARQRINTALALGELQRAGYGPTLAMQAVQSNLGIGVNTYVIADFNALIKLVDTLGGIDVNVPAPIADYQFPDAYSGYDPLILSAGLQHMDGYTAQKYARTRHGDSDFDRARRQQQVLFAMRDRILSGNALPQLILQAPSLYGSLSQNVYTDLSLQQMIQLALWLKDIPIDNIHTGVIDSSYVSDFVTDDGAQVLIPNTAALPSLLAQVFGSDYGQS